jgi:hypothetical protein
MACLEALLGRVGEGEIAKVAIRAALRILSHWLACHSPETEGTWSAYQGSDGLVEFLHIHVIALPLLLRGLLLDLSRPRAAGDSRSDHFSAFS